MTSQYAGRLSKMPVAHDPITQYRLNLADESLDVNAWLGRRIRLEYTGEIRCTHCQRKTNKSFNQGYCYPCFQKLAQCDRCIMSPELCHFAQGTCREPEWGEVNCMTSHIVYLANSSGLKVGITRKSQVPIRWMDQGARKALPILEVSSRHLAGLVESALREWVSDRTNWRKLLKNESDEVDLVAERDRLRELSEGIIDEIVSTLPDAQLSWLDESVLEFDYPAIEWPEKAKTYNLDKTPVIEDRLIAIKGQYLIFENAALNIRKYTSYDVTISVLD